MFKIGDKVYLREDSEWNDGADSNPLNMVGVIIKFTPEEPLDYVVEWNNGENNGYESKDLLLVSSIDSPQVTITQAEYDNLVEEVNMLQELIAELSAPQDTAQEQQAETYRALQMLLVSHPSFQDGAGENTTHLEELVNTVMELQAAWDRLASTPKKDVTDTTGFKPISEYTLADWVQALEEGWVFECHGAEFRIKPTYIDGDYDLTRTLDGFWIAGETDCDDIVKRIK